MFKLQDGRQHLYQWDLDRYIIVDDPNICEVHFCNRTSDESLVVEVKDGLAAIPNIILQEARPIRAYAYCDDKYTLVEEQFAVKSRTRPSDYIYHETEVIRWQTIAENAEKANKEAMDAASVATTAADELYDYVAEHKLSFIDDEAGNVTLQGVEVGLDADTVATKDYVDTAISEIDIPTVPTNVSAFTNDAGYLTEHQDISGKADKVHSHTLSDITDYKEPDLSEYAKKSDIPDVDNFITAIPAEYVTESELNAKGYLTSVPSTYAKKSDIPSLDGYAKKTDIPSLDGYATETYVNDAIANIDLPEVDVTGDQLYCHNVKIGDKVKVAPIYTTSAEPFTYSTLVEYTWNNGGTIPATGANGDAVYYEFVVDAADDEYTVVYALDISSKGSSITTISATNSTITDTVVKVADTIITGEGAGSDVDLSNYYNKTETDAAIAEAVGNISVPDVSNKADKEHTHSISDITDYVAPDLTGYATEDYVTTAINNALSGIATAEGGSY